MKNLIISLSAFAVIIGGFNSIGNHRRIQVLPTGGAWIITDSIVTI